MSTPTTWTDLDDAILEREWKLGTETRQITRILMQCGSSTTIRTRHAVIGRAFRQGLGQHPIAAKKRPPTPNIKPMKYRNVHDISLAYVPTDAEIQRIAMERAR